MATDVNLALGPVVHLVFNSSRVSTECVQDPLARRVKAPRSGVAVRNSYVLLLDAKASGADFI